jgi:DNA invertase Pin-like site-specific DNA recombinase
LHSTIFDPSYNNTKHIASNPNWELADIYADEGLTGTRADKRAEFQRMMRDCRKGKIDKILVKSVTRFARNVRDCLEYVRELKLIGVTVLFEEQNIDRSTADEMFISMQGSIAQEESLSISGNMRWSYKRRMESGDLAIHLTALGVILLPYRRLLVHYARHFQEVDRTKAHAV